MRLKVDEVERLVLKHKKISENTKDNYKYALRTVKAVRENWFETTFDVMEWINSLPKEYSDETVETYFDLVLACGNFLQRNMGRNPDGSYKFINVIGDLSQEDRPHAKRKVHRVWNNEELKLIMESCRGEQDIALVNTLFESCCRIHELEGLTMRDFDVTGFTCGRGKKTGQRHYSMDIRIIEFLSKLVSSADEPIFKAHNGRPANVSMLMHRLERIMKRAGITGRKRGAHTFRHTGATMIAIKSRSALAVKAKLVHDKIETSMGYIQEVEEKIQQTESPMALLNVAPAEIRQSELTTSVAVVDGIKGEVIEAEDLTSKMFDYIPDNIRIRPALDNDDLGLVRSVMVEFARTYRGDRRIYECQSLLKRMLRKVV
jgi:integrase